MEQTLYEAVTDSMYGDVNIICVERHINKLPQYDFLRLLSEGLDHVLAGRDKKIAELARKLAQRGNSAHKERNSALAEIEVD